VSPADWQVRLTGPSIALRRWHTKDTITKGWIDMCNRNQGFKHRVLSIAVCTALTLAFVPASRVAHAQNTQTAQNTVAQYDIPAQPLETALQQIADKQGLQLLYSPSDLKGVSTRGIKGTYSTKEAVERLIEGTGLAASFNGQNAVAIKPKGEEKKTGAAGGASNGNPNQAARAQVAGAGEPAGAAASNGKQAGEEESQSATAKLEQITVTGTHIRGVSPAAPMIVIDREEIDRSGYTVVSDLVNSLPQNYSGGNTPQLTLSNGPTPGNTNYTGGYSPNLRGLGPKSTLTLINGHRLGQDGLSGSVDISLIPIDALERVEVVTDGASAAYGSDAVAGVINFVLRKTYDGAQTNISYGIATGGGGTEKRASQVFGKAWQDGNALVAYEHDEQEAVDVTQRGFTSSVAAPTSLLPQSTRDSFLVTANQRITPGLSVFFDGLYTSRKSSYLSSYPPEYALPTLRNPTSVEQFLANGGFTVDLVGKWKATVVVSAAKERALGESFYTMSTGDTLNAAALSRGTTTGVEINVDGPVGSINGNTARAALGAGTRHESIDYYDVGYPPLASGNRDVRYVFGELNAPIYTRAGLPGLDNLTLSASGRYDDYSDSEGKFVPKVGFVYGPADSVNIRASMGKSFSAPTIRSLTGPVQVDVLSIPDPNSPSGTSQILYSNGGNSALKPETATTWSAGIDYDPEWAPGLHLTATYFDIDYRNRVFGFTEPQNSFTDPTYSPLVTRNPSASAQSALIAGAGGGFFNFSGAPYNPATTTAIVNGTSVNLSRQQISGVDLGGAYKMPLRGGVLNLFLNGTYLTLTQQITPASSSENIAGIAFNPPRIRVRGGGTWTSGPWSTTLTANWLGSSTNTYVVPFTKISSWTTVDAQVAYAPRLTGIWSGVKLSLSAQNLFNRNPPYLTFDGFLPGVHYDSTNASPLGRFVTAQLRKSW